MQNKLNFCTKCPKPEDYAHQLSGAACISQLEVTRTLADYRRAASVLWGEGGEYCVDEFERLNRDHFAGVLPPLPIVIGITAYGKCIGLTRGGGSWDESLPRITIASNQFRVGSQKVTEILLHEMIHAKLMLAKQNPDHNDKPWCSEIMRLSREVFGKEILADPVNPRRVDGKVVRKARDGYLTRDEIAKWPDCLRDESWEPGRRIRLEFY
jgi:hypothetical protein